MSKKKKPTTDPKNTKIPQEIIEAIKTLNVIESTRRPFGALDVDALLNEDGQHTYVELVESAHVVLWFAGEEPDTLKASNWLEENRERLTIEKLSQVVQMAMVWGERLAVENRTAQRHKDAPAIDAEIEKLWHEFDAKGMSKNNAAPRIAKEVGLKESTVRKKLKGR